LTGNKTTELQRLLTCSPSKTSDNIIYCMVKKMYVGIRFGLI